MQKAVNESGGNPNEDASQGNAFRKSGGMWKLTYKGSEVYVNNRKGMEFIRFLVRNQGQELRSSQVYNLDAERQIHETDFDQVDDKAIARIRNHEKELINEIEEAKNRELPREEIEGLEEQLGMIRHWLSSQTDNKGKPRKSSGQNENARKYVQRAIKKTVDLIAKDHPALGEHFRGSIKTGIECSYSPPEKVKWIFS